MAVDDGRAQVYDKTIDVTPGRVFFWLTLRHGKHVQVANKYNVQEMSTLTKRQTLVADLLGQIAQDTVIEEGFVDSTNRNRTGESEESYEPYDGVDGNDCTSYEGE